MDAVSGESDTTNNCSSGVVVTIGVGPAPDLVVDMPTVSNSAPTAGARITLSATVRNQGSGRSDSTTLRYYQSIDSTIKAGDTEVGTDTVSRLNSSGSGDESISLNAPSTPGTFYFGGVCGVGVRRVRHYQQLLKWRAHERVQHCQRTGPTHRTNGNG